MNAITETLQYVIAPVIGLLLFIVAFAKLNQLLFPINPAITLMIDFIILVILLVTGYSILDRKIRHSL
ncbi:MAG: hypothetical protein AB4040_19165 [Synechococcus sp.]